MAKDFNQTRFLLVGVQPKESHRECWNAQLGLNGQQRSDWQNISGWWSRCSALTELYIAKTVLLVKKQEQFLRFRSFQSHNDMHRHTNCLRPRKSCETEGAKQQLGFSGKNSKRKSTQKLAKTRQRVRMLLGSQKIPASKGTRHCVLVWKGTKVYIYILTHWAVPVWRVPSWKVPWYFFTRVSTEWKGSSAFLTPGTFDTPTGHTFRSLRTGSSSAGYLNIHALSCSTRFEQSTRGFTPNTHWT